MDFTRLCLTFACGSRRRRRDPSQSHRHLICSRRPHPPPSRARHTASFHRETSFEHASSDSGDTEESRICFFHALCPSRSQCCSSGRQHNGRLTRHRERTAPPPPFPTRSQRRVGRHSTAPSTFDSQPQLIPQDPRTVHGRTAAPSFRALASRPRTTPSPSAGVQRQTSKTRAQDERHSGEGYARSAPADREGSAQLEPQGTGAVRR